MRSNNTFKHIKSNNNAQQNNWYYCTLKTKRTATCTMLVGNKYDKLGDVQKTRANGRRAGDRCINDEIYKGNGIFFDKYYGAGKLVCVRTHKLRRRYLHVLWTIGARRKQVCSVIRKMWVPRRPIQICRKIRIRPYAYVRRSVFSQNQRGICRPVRQYRKHFAARKRRNDEPRFVHRQVCACVNLRHKL